MAGLEAARARGRHGGRPRALDDEACVMARELYRANTNLVSAIAKRLGVAKRTLYCYLEQNQSPKRQHSSSNFSSRRLVTALLILGLLAMNFSLRLFMVPNFTQLELFSTHEAPLTPKSLSV
jgi:hypothetical protein